MHRRAVTAAILAGAVSCGGGAERTVVLAVSARAGVDLAAVTWSSPETVRRVERGPGRIELVLDADRLPAAIELHAPGACPQRASLEGATAGERRRAEIAPWIDLGEDRPQLGFDAAFEITARPGCREAVAGKITWRVVEGALAEQRAEQNGFRFFARTVPLPRSREALPWGIVPLSPATRGAATLEATWEGLGPTTKLTVRVAAAARASGVPAIAVGQRVLLGGEGWRVRERPQGGRAEVRTEGEAPSFQPDTSGRWVLEDARGEPFSLRAGRHGETPLDCGRSECHASAAAGAASTRMTTVLFRELSGERGPSFDVRCALACHTAGEPGLPDGGFVQTLRELGSPLPAIGAGAWLSLPRHLRRLGGVTCTTCHGPGAIPERPARWTILRSDVCATCHDAPPRYGHVAAWKRTRMSRADADPRARREPCARCHTTAGFLASIGVRPLPASSGGPAEATGIGCAACHAPHAARTDRALIRAVGADTGPSRICLPCHAPSGGDRERSVPSASAAVLAAEGAHARVKDACLGCHAAGPLDVERGRGHQFAVDRARCAGCHDCPQEERPGPGGKRIAERARALAEALRRRGVLTGGEGAAPHAGIEVKAKPGSPEERAAWEVLTVLEDPAAWAHDAAGARRRLDDAEKVR